MHGNVFDNIVNATPIIQCKLAIDEKQITSTKETSPIPLNRHHTVKDEPTTANDKLTTVKNEIVTAKNEIAVAELEVTAVKHKVTTAKGEVTTAKVKITAAGVSLATQKRRFTNAKDKFEAAEERLREVVGEHNITTASSEVVATWNELVTADQQFDTAQHKLPIAQQELAIAQQGLAIAHEQFVTAQHKLITAQNKLFAIQDEFFTAQHKSSAIKDEFMTAQHEHELMITCQNDTYIGSRAQDMVAALASDCLRLSMHFFHPIQQCAQQIYHSALPLSPTSSLLREFCLQTSIDNNLPLATAFSGAPNNWGLLLRTIDIRPKQLTCIKMSFHRIVAACENTVDIYDAVTGVLRQSLYALERVAKIQDSLDGSTLFFMHSSSVTMWDVQTGGLIHTFIAKPMINDVSVSRKHVACGLSDGSVTFWNIHTKEEGKGFGNSQPVIFICWLSPWELAVATQNSLNICDIIIGETLSGFFIPEPVWGVVHLQGKGRFLVGASQPRSGGGQGSSSFATIEYMQRCDPAQGPELRHGQPICLRKSPTQGGQLSSPTLVGEQIVCITLESGVQIFDISSNNWINSPPLLGGAMSVAVSLNRNIVVQTNDSIQIFSSDVMTSAKNHKRVRWSHIYPLGEKYIICLQPNRCLTLLELETLQELHPLDDISSVRAWFRDQSAAAHASFGRGLVAEFSVSAVIQMWKSGARLPKQTGGADEDPPLQGWSPRCTRRITVHSLPQPELCVHDMRSSIILARLPLLDAGFGTGEVYDLIFDSETRFHLKIDGSGQHVQIPYEITSQESGSYSHSITKGKPVPLSEPRSTPIYTLDASCEWVIDSKSRKICWMSGNVRRGNGGHFWAGLSLVMIGDDGVVRKLTFKEPNC